MASAAVDRVIERLVGVKPLASGWVARCPAHEDRDPSLKVDEADDGGVLIHCHAGCTPVAVMSALGLTLADLFPPRETSERAHTPGKTTRYDVLAPDGALIATHVRRDFSDGGKEVWWEQPDGARGLNGHKVHDLPLYGVHELTSQTAVVVCEGEKARDALARRGIAAVGTVTGASGAPGKDALRPLLGRTVLLWPDRDPAGDAHMGKIAALLTTIGHPRGDVLRVVWPDAPPKGDAADFAGNDDALLALIDAARPWFAPSAEPATNADAKDEAITAHMPPLPDAAFYGSFARYRELMAPTTEAPDAFHLASALTLVGAMIGRRVYAEYASEQLFGNLYTVLIGASGSSRKDTAIKRATNLSSWITGRAVTPPFYISRDVSSSEGIVQTLKNFPNTWIYLTELSAMLANAKRKGTTSIVDRLIEAWDTPEVLQNLNKQSPAEARKPYLSIISGTQPGRLAAEIRPEDIHSGFANRWLFFPGAGKPRLSRPANVDRKAAWSLYLSWFDAIHSYAEGEAIGWDAGANARWDAWYQRDGEGRGVDEDADAMRVRHATLIQKVALIFAVSDGAKAIADAHLAAAIALIDWMWSAVQLLMRDWGVGIGSRIETKIESALRQRGPMTRRDLQRACTNRAWTGYEFGRQLDAMLKNETILTVDKFLAWSEG